MHTWRIRHIIEHQAAGAEYIAGYVATSSNRGALTATAVLSLRMHQSSTCPAPVEVGEGNYNLVVTFPWPQNGLHKIMFGCLDIYHSP